MNKPGAIPGDDILDAYITCSTECRIALSNIIRSQGYLVSTLLLNPETKVLDVMLDWKADPPASIALVMGMVQVGQKQFGDVWLQILKENLSQLT